LRTDLRILAWTVVTVVLRQPVAVHRETGATTLRRRPPASRPEPVPTLPGSGSIALTAEAVEPASRTAADLGTPVR
jgi:hypothetical protein